MVTNERGYCNWEYTGEYETNKKGVVKKTEWITDCGETVYWTYENGEIIETRDLLMEIVSAIDEFTKQN